ncbi:YesL family protein [Metabacillus sp. Hm71]|uniref:YesL family protein n=1 Tax=Metabacillus sp. Hm71 TaxID=3450743 RepID=UPI003F42B318
MEEKKEFGQGILFIATNYIYWLLVTNLYFILTNSLFIFFFMTLKPSFSNIIVYFLALIPTGPALASLCYSMEKLVRTKELSPTRDFFYGYRKNIKDTFSVWLPILIVYFILLVDLQYLRQSASETSQILSIVIFILTIVWTMLCLNILIINSRYKFRVRDVFKLSVYYSFMKFKHTIGNLLILFIVAFLSVMTTDFFIVFTASIIAFLMMLNMKEMLKDIEMNFLKKGSEN